MSVYVYYSPPVVNTLYMKRLVDATRSPGGL